MKDLSVILEDLDEELVRAKMFVNENGYHNGTAINAIVRRYRNELREYRRIVAGDHLKDGIKDYGYCKIIEET